ncbi:hypothetical protein PR202_gb09621 [Eleusine coracana subsp. coracana]|uniref:tRNA (guanine(9)-N(1))-methyltransferase n=1 Tax=Eleusine coracana subsp. coracana TaxID=191504 RepID=A0AAV5EIA2_ELECO|nr:hypothetical protein QOZ80_2BG0199390 [Eleusine coracana subsp. coracana]GJN22088.1 hypothetical protein PR202_gb09621 [Eleusine coracana subsp. coracana]
MADVAGSQPAAVAEGVVEQPPELSKRARKKLQKKEMRAARNAARKAADKERHRANVEQRRRERAEELAAAPSEEVRQEILAARRESRRQRVDHNAEQRSARAERLRRAAEGAGQKVVLDLEFAQLMRPTEIHSLTKQIMYCYAVNRRSANPAHLWLTGCNGEMATHLQKLSGYDKWFIEKEAKSYIEAFEDRKENLVYLTADAETVLDDLDLSKIYIIGGLVDRNKWKGITQEKAAAQGIQTAKLPIGNYLKLSSSQVLTVNQVFEILLKFVETRDWKTAFFDVIPQRKRGEAEAEVGKVSLDDDAAEAGKASLDDDDDAAEEAANGDNSKEDINMGFDEDADDDDDADEEELEVEEIDVAKKRQCVRPAGNEEADEEHSAAVAEATPDVQQAEQATIE